MIQLEVDQGGNAVVVLRKRTGWVSSARQSGDQLVLHA